MQETALSSVIQLADEKTPIAPVAGWRRWIGSDGRRTSELLVSQHARPAHGDEADEALAPRISRAALLRHPGLARVLEAGADGQATRVIEEVGNARPLATGQRIPRGEALARELVRLLEALAYLHRQGLSHSSVSRETVFSDGRRLLLTGTALSRETSERADADLREWAELVLQLVEPGAGKTPLGLGREAPDQVLQADKRGATLDPARVLRAIERARGPGDADVAHANDETGDPERSWQMRALLATVHFIGSLIVGLFTTVLTVALIGGAVALGVMWFLGQLPQETQVPMVVKMEREQARERLEREGLSVARVRKAYREDIEPGHVAETDPPPGMTVREGREITLVVSMGAARVKAPRLVGLRLDEARALLKKKGLRLIDGGKMRSDAPEGEIVEQDPAPGRKIAQGERIVVHTSGGPDFGLVEVAGEDDSPEHVLFRRVEIVVPRGEALQRVVVREGYGDDLETTYDRLHRPGDRIKLDTHGRPGKQVTVTIEGDVVYRTKL